MSTLYFYKGEGGLIAAFCRRYSQQVRFLNVAKAENPAGTAKNHFFHSNRLHLGTQLLLQ